MALGDESAETYRTLQNNLDTSGFKQAEPSFRWERKVEGIKVAVEFLCETDSVEQGRIFRPKGEHTGSKLGAFNVRGAQLAALDFIEHEIEGERLDGGGASRVTLRVANVLPYVVLKINAFQDRHANKDAYDLVFVLLNYGDGAREAGAVAARSPVARSPQVAAAMVLLAERFETVGHDGPSAYAQFLVPPGDVDDGARLRQEALAVVRTFLTAFKSAATPS